MSEQPTRPREIFFVDTTLRDGQLSLWASNMRTGMMLPVAERLDRAGFEAIEVMSSAFYKKCVRDLKDDPWERLRLLRQRIKETPLRSIRSRAMLAFQITPLAVADLWLERLAANGISELRTSDPSNTPSYWKQAVDAAKRAGLKTILNVIYSISPKHTDDALTEATSKSAAPRMATVTAPRRFRFTTFAASPGSMPMAMMPPCGRWRTRRARFFLRCPVEWQRRQSEAGARSGLPCSGRTWPAPG